MAALSLNALLREFRADGLLTLLGGHYNWPGEPSASAAASAADIARQLGAFGDERTLAHIFVNDIGASCTPGGQCAVGQGSSRRAGVAVIERWAERFLPELEATLASGQESDTWERGAQALRETLAHVPELKGQVEALTQLPLATAAYDLEQLLYFNTLEHFRPLVLTRKVGCALPAALFERSMNNGASRLLHALQKEGRAGGLQIDDAGAYSVVDAHGNRIELRQERTGPDGMHAANKCSAILAQLFYKVCKNMARRPIPGGGLTVFYLIPCFDRHRLRDGMRAFFGLFPDLEHWFKVERVTLISAFYANPDEGAILCDVLSRNVSESVPTYALRRVTAR